jgi:hypothetical protein
VTTCAGDTLCGRQAAILRRSGMLPEWDAARVQQSRQRKEGNVNGDVVISHAR